MPNDTKAAFLRELTRRFSSLRRLEGSQSLYEVGDGAARVYVRYSKLHNRNQAFYGLRQEDIRRLEGHPSVVCFLWDGQREPLLVPFSHYEDVFHSTSPARDGQYKVLVRVEGDGTELYIARAGRFNVEAYFGWDELQTRIDSARLGRIPDMSHSQVQTLLGAIGNVKSYMVWIPPSDRVALDWAIATRFDCSDTLPVGFERARSILQEVDVVWIERGSSRLRALFEVEHSTPIYSALLRFNDVHLAAPDLRPGFSVVANDARRDLFVRQLNRPTFRASGLSELCTFLEYADVFRWYRRVKAE